MSPTPVKRKLVAILAADAVGYSRMMGADEEGTMKVLSAHRSMIDGIIEFHEGRIINTAGDSVLAEFASPVQAVRCAVEIQDALETRNESLPEERRMRFRIGVNLGDVMVKGDDLLGDGVNVAARLEGIAEPGNIYIASSVYDQIAGKLNLGFVDLGNQSLKNIDRPIRAYRIERGGTVATLPAPWRGAGLWIAGVLAFVLVAAALGWFFGVQPMLRSAEQAKIESENSRLRLEAAETKQRAADEAKAVAEAKRSLDERRAAEGRARQDADLGRARAEAEAAKRKAAADEAARRSAERAARPAVAPAPQQPVETKLAAAPPAAALVTPRAAQPARAAAPPLNYQGNWQAALSCRPFAQRQGFNITIPVSVTDGSFNLQRGQAGAAESFQLSGRPEANGRLLLAGDGVAGSASRRQKSGQPYKATFDGRFEGPQYNGKGQLGAQDCALAITRAP